MFSNESSNNWLAGKTAIIVSAETIQAVHLRKVLSRAGVQVLDTLITVDEIPPAMEKGTPDFMLLDMTILPYQHAEIPPGALTIPCSCKILLSSLPEQESQAAVSEWGADGFITKPMDHERILSCLCEIWASLRRP